MTRKIKINITILICCLFLGALNARGQEQFSRNIEQTVFVPKGQWITGISANYSQSKYDNYQFLVLENINGDNYSFKVSPMLCFAFKDDLAAGARFAYKRSRMKFSSADIVLSYDDSYDIENAYVITQNFETTAFLRNYMSIGKSKRFGIVNEIGLKYGLSESKITNDTGTDFSGDFLRTHSVSVGVTPGLLMFLNNYSALEVNVGVLELSFSKTKQTSNQVHVAELKSSFANFKVNLLSISIGLVFYL